ncbi:MAG: DUF3793 family protein [Erysipelotrichaceae bacterium]
MLNEIIVRLCSPTLAGIKSGNLFSFQYTDKQELLSEIVYYNHLLNHKGLYVEILKLTSSMALIYIYRKEMLKKKLNNEEIQTFLSEHGYQEYSIESCFEILKEHLLQKDFPHEIGIFLDYPLADVKAFIKYKGKDCLYIGHWKVYDDLHFAKKLFEQYDCCTRNFYRRYRKGFEITQLAVAV